MIKETLNHIKTTLLLLSVLMILTGFIYPVVVTGLSQLFFPWKANGSLLEQNGQTVGSRLIGQSFSSATYFCGRPSATTPYPYNGASSSGSNFGPSNPDFLTTIKGRIEQLKQADPQNNLSIPVDLITASGSGLDPEISPLAALYQVSRIAKSRQIPEADVIALITKYQHNRTWRILGEPRLNVLELNLALDNLRIEHDLQSPRS